MNPKEGESMDVSIREFLESDAKDLAHYANDKRIAAFIRDDFPQPYSVEDAERFIKVCLDREHTNRIARAICMDDKFIGTISIMFNRQDDVYRKSAEIGYWLGVPFWGKGIMTSAIVYMCNLAFKYCNIERIYAETFEINTASRRCLEKAGFTYEGTLRNHICKYNVVQNSCMYSILRDEVPYLEGV